VSAADYEALGRRAVACAAFEWRAGMWALLSGFRLALIVSVGNGDLTVVVEATGRTFVYSRRAWSELEPLPDLKQPATLGAAFDLIPPESRRELLLTWAMAYELPEASGGAWAGSAWGYLAGSLVAALEAAPARS